MTEQAAVEYVHGDRSQGYLKGCRCSECRAANAAYNRELKARRLAEGKFTHGTEYGYNVGCRCDDCVEAKRNRRAKKSRQARHGTSTRWRQGCRCALCDDSAAANKARATEEEKRRVAAMARRVAEVKVDLGMDPDADRRTRQAQFAAAFDMRVRQALQGISLAVDPRHRSPLTRIVLLPGRRMFLVELRAEPPWDTHPNPPGLEALATMSTPVHRVFGPEGLRNWLIARSEEAGRISARPLAPAIARQHVKAYR